ncbi:MAG: KH domain-containing protein, partial [Dehalococcoidales bacterium]|nr:KH domain-containing protein [Dehalococcoidales bacterium]
MGLGAEDARIRVELVTSVPEKDSDISEIAETARGVLEKLLDAMGIFDTTVSESEQVVEQEAVSAPIVLNVEGSDLGILIGRRGQTLSSLQYIVRLIVGHQTKASVPIIIDVEGYKQRRFESLRTLAFRIAEQVMDRGTPFT